LKFPQKQKAEARRPGPAVGAYALLLLVLQAGNEHLLGLLGRLEVVLEDAPEEVRQLLVALLLGVLNVGLQDSTLSEEW
jgi:hypothetical protein